MIKNALCGMIAILLAVHSSNAKALEPDMAVDVVIVGGGIAGLTAAYTLKKQFKNLLVMEKGSRIGGRIWDDTYRGFSYARGAEYLGEPEGVIGQIIKSYKLKPIEMKSPAICHYNPNVPDYEDIKIWNGYYGIAMMHVREDAARIGSKMALEEYNTFQQFTTEFVDATYEAGELPHMFDLSHMVANFDFVSMQEWFDGQYWGPTYQDKWNSHARGLYGAPMSEVSILMAISELGWEYYQLPDIDMPEDDWNDYKRGQYATETYSFMKGLTALPKAITSDKDLKKKILTHTKVTKIETVKNLYVIHYEHKLSGKVGTLNTEKVILAVPATIALKIASNVISEEIKEIMSNIKYCEYLTVNMMSEKPLMINQTADGEEIDNFTFELSTPDNFWVVSFYEGLYVQKIRNPKHPMNDEVYVTTAYIAGNSCSDKLVKLSNDEILERTYKDLDKIFPGASKKVVEHKVNRFKNAYPLMGKGAYHEITKLNKLNMEQSAIRLVGDYLALPTIEATMEQAAFAVQNLR